MRLSEYLSEHPNLWSGKPIYVTLQCNQNMLNDVIDSFGTNVRIVPLSNDQITVHVRASEQAMFYWAIQFAESVEVVSPESLRLRIKNTLKEALNKYE